MLELGWKRIILEHLPLQMPRVGSCAYLYLGNVKYKLAREMTFAGDPPSALRTLKFLCELKIKERVAQASGTFTYACLDELRKAGKVSHILSMNITDMMDSYPDLSALTTFVHGN